MSDEEDIGSEQELEPEQEPETEAAGGDEVQEHEHPGAEKAEKQTKEKKPKKEEKEDDTGLTEGEKAMMAAKKRQEDEQAALLQAYEERRRIEREKEEEELRKLKEKQEQRRLEREEEERELAEKLRLAEEQRKAAEEEKKAKADAEKRKKEEEKEKRKKLLAGSFASAIESGGLAKGRNFVIPKKKEQKDKFDNIFQAKQEMGLTREQQNELKRAYMEQIVKELEFPGLSDDELKDKIRALHQRICRLEAEKYDLEKRHERQQYDLKELTERQRQVFRNNALKKGIDPTDTMNSRYPPKVSLISKYERQIDRRNFAERRAVYEKKDSYPCFPNVPPPPARYDKIILNADGTMPEAKPAEPEQQIQEAENEEEGGGEGEEGEGEGEGEEGEGEDDE